ncbi:MAG: aspartate aminotransferase family protein [Desulfovibrionaceae bacterium]
MSHFERLKQREESLLMHTYGRYPLALKRAEGCRLWDFDGREYVDLLSGIAVANLGHCRPELAETMAAKARELVHVSNLFYQEDQLILAEKLLATCGAERVFFCNSGAEANEGAIKLARRYMRTIKEREAYKIVTLEGSFHGRTLATLTATGQPGRIKDHFGPLPEGFQTVPFGDLDAMAAALDDTAAAVLIEMVQGEGGVKPLPREYVDGLKELCAERGVLIIADEIQTGLGRTGTFWAHEQYGLAPDIFTSAKGLANGLPMGAVLASAEVARGFEPGTHATTFGGGGVLAAVAAKTVDLLNKEKLPQRAAEVGKYATDLFEGLKAKHPGKIVEVRGMGLLLGVVLSFPGKAVWEALMRRGFVLNLTHETVLRLLPPLTIPRADLAAFAQALDEVLAETPAA